MCWYLSGRFSDDGDEDDDEVSPRSAQDNKKQVPTIDNDNDDVGPKLAQGMSTSTVRKGSRIIKSKIVNLILREI